jgi:hypothetical protein
MASGLDYFIRCCRERPKGLAARVDVSRVTRLNLANWSGKGVQED